MSANAAKPISDKIDLIWGARAIGAALNLAENEPLRNAIKAEHMRATMARANG
jgi:hypothetical protein